MKSKGEKPIIRTIRNKLSQLATAQQGIFRSRMREMRHRATWTLRAEKDGNKKKHFFNNFVSRAKGKVKSMSYNTIKCSQSKNITCSSCPQVRFSFSPSLCAVKLSDLFLNVFPVLATPSLSFFLLLFPPLPASLVAPAPFLGAEDLCCFRHLIKTKEKSQRVNIWHAPGEHLACTW